MSEIKLDIFSVPVTAKPRKLQVKWSLENFSEPEKKLKIPKLLTDPILILMKKIGYKVKEEFVEIDDDEFGKALSEEIRKEVDQEILKEMNNYTYGQDK
jgi:hypothetical protein